MSEELVGRCIGCRHNFALGPCGGCGATAGDGDTWDGTIQPAQCPGDCDDDCEACGSLDWERMCDDCRFYAAQDAEVLSDE